MSMPPNFSQAVRANVRNESSSWSSSEEATTSSPGISPDLSSLNNRGSNLRCARSPVAPNSTTTCGCSGPIPASFVPMAPSSRIRRRAAHRRGDGAVPANRLHARAGGASDQATVAGPTGELVARRQLQLAEHARDMGLDGLDRDEQLFGDLLVRVPARDQPHHLALAYGQPVEVLVDLGDLDRSRERIEHESRQPRREDSVALGYASYRLDQLRPRDALRHVPARAGADDADDVFGCIADRKCEKTHLRRRAVYLRDHLCPTATRQLDIEEHDIGPMLQNGRHGGIDVLRLADDVDRAFDLGAHTRTEQRMVVDDHDPQSGRRHCCSPPSSRCLGIDNLTSVPSPGALRILADPPCRSIRAKIDSLIPILVPPVESPTVSGSNPV